MRSDFKKELGSLGSDDVHIDKLSCGAKIRRIFTERFSTQIAQNLSKSKSFRSYCFCLSLPEELFNVKTDENELRKNIGNAIENLYGYNGVLNTPFKAVELLSRQQIIRLEGPIKRCILSVVKELKNAVRACTQRVSMMRHSFI